MRTKRFWRRWVLVEFPHYYPPSQRDPDLGDRLTEPETLSGVLNWAIEGRQRVLEQGYFTNEDHDAQRKRERWQAWGESVDKFISECVERDPEADRLTTGDAHRRYAAWCREFGLDPVGQREFTNSLKDEDVGYKSSVRIDGSSQRGYKALGLTDDVPELDATPDRDADPATKTHALGDYDENDDTDGEGESEEDGHEADDENGENDDGDTEEENTGLAVNAMRMPIYETVADLEGDADGDDPSVPIEDVVASVIHTPEKACEHIQALIENGALTRDGDRVRTATTDD